MNVPSRRSSGWSARRRAASASRRVSAAICVERLPVGVEHDRHEQRVVRSDGDADVDAGVALDLAVDVRRVEARKRLQRSGGRLHDEVVDRRSLVAFLARSAPQRRDQRHVDVGRDGEGRDRRRRLDHPARDRRLRRRQLERARIALSSGRGLVHFCARLGRGLLDVLARDPAARGRCPQCLGARGRARRRCVSPPASRWDAARPIRRPQPGRDGPRCSVHSHRSRASRSVPRTEPSRPRERGSSRACRRIPPRRRRSPCRSPPRSGRRLARTCPPGRPASGR